MGTIEKQALEREEIIYREGKRVSELTAEKERLQDEVRELSERVKASETKVLEQDEEIRKKEGEHSSDQLSNSTFEIKNLQQQVKELSEELQASQVKVKRREDEVTQNASLEKERLQHQLNELTDRIRSDEIKALEREKEVRKRETEQLSKSTAETERLKEHLLTTNKKVKDLVKEFEEKLEAAEKSRVEQLSNAEADKERLQHQLSELRDIKELEQEEFIKREAEHFSQTTLERERLEHQVKELIEKLRASEIQENEVNKLKAQLSASLQYESEAKDLKSQLKHCEDKISKLAENLTNMAMLELDNQDLKQRLLECETNLKEKNAALEAHAAEEKLRDAQISHLQEKNKKLEVEKESLTSDLAAAKERHKTLGQARITIGKKLADSLKESEALKKEVGNLKEGNTDLLQERIKNQEEWDAVLGQQKAQNEKLKTKIAALEAVLKEKEEHAKSDNFIKRCKVNLKQIDENILNKADIDLLKAPKPAEVTEERISALEAELNSEREQKQIFEKETYENISKVATLERKLSQEIQLRKDVAAELSKSKDPNKGPGYKQFVELKAELSESKKKIQDLTNLNNDQKQIIEAQEKNSTESLKKVKEELEMASKGANMLKEEKEVLKSALSKAKEEMEKARKSLEHLKEIEKQKTSLTAEATELKRRCKSLEDDKESLSKLNAKVEQEKEQLKQDIETARKSSDNCSEDRFTNLEKMYKEEMRSKKRLETELMEYKIAKLEEEKNDLDAKIAIADSSTTLAEIRSLEKKVDSLTKSLNIEKDTVRTVTSERDKFKSRLDDLRAYRDKYDTEKKKRIELEKAVESEKS